MYYLPILVNNRKYVILPLKDAMHEDINESSFLVPLVKENEQPELFSLLPNSRATSNNGKNEDIDNLALCIDSCKYTHEEGSETEKLVLVLEEKRDSDNMQQSKVEIGKVSITQSASGFVVKSECGGEYKYKVLCVEIVLKRTIEKEYKTSLFFHLIPKKNAYYDASLDFGSEASQAGFKDGSVFKPINLIENAKYISCSDGNDFRKTPAKDFLQYDEDDETLFRTIFYIEKKYNRPRFLSKRIEDDELQSEDYELIPNIKIALLDEKEDRNKVLVVYRKAILNFIETIIYAILKGKIDKHIGIQLKLLVPNVMSIGAIKTLIQNIYDKLQLDDILGEYVHLEITPVSESDASFAGYVEENEVKEQRTFLTIDAGKGTMDYSITRIDKEGHIENLYQNGFIGAGNAVTYALFDHVCAVIIGSTDSRKRKKLMKQVLMDKQSDQKGLRDLHEALEKIKRTYETKDSIESVQQRCKNLQDKTQNQTDELIARGLASILNEVGTGSLGDQYSIIHKMCYDICSKLVLSLDDKVTMGTSKSWKIWKNIGKQKKLHVDEVLLTGRAFRFPLLRETLEKLLKEKWGEAVSVKLLPNSKSLCLRGALRSDLSVNLNCGLPSKPQIYKTSKLDNTGFNYDTSNVFNIDEHFLNKGQEIDERSAIFFNGHEWSVGGMNHRMTGELYFTGEQPILRHQDSIDVLEPRLQINENSMVFESKFPIYNQESEGNNVTLFNIDNLS